MEKDSSQAILSATNMKGKPTKPNPDAIPPSWPLDRLRPNTVDATKDGWIGKKKPYAHKTHNQTKCPI